MIICFLSKLCRVTYQMNAFDKLNPKMTWKITLDRAGGLSMRTCALIPLVSFSKYTQMRSVGTRFVQK